MKRHSAAFSIFLASVVWHSCGANAQAQQKDAQTLVQQADAMQLWTNRCWLTLGHYKSTWLGWKSAVDDPAFFLAPDGRTNPKSELTATLRAFYEPVTDEKQHAVNRFPARLHWLEKALEWDGSGLPMHESTAFREMYAKFKPTSVTLVYPTAYMNSLSTMFGHTMLVFDSSPRNRLLARSVTYAAHVEPDFITVLAIKSLFGFYKGYYGSLPYYDTVKEYTAMGHRDMWEYTLDFNQSEVDQMLRHAWELQHVSSSYYFFTENCAYNLLYLLDVARPSLCATDYDKLFVIPVDTVKFIEGTLGIVREKRYRPSQVSQIEFLAKQLDVEARKSALAMAHGQPKTNNICAAGSKQSDGLIFDLAMEHVRFIYNDKKLGIEEYRARSREIFNARIRLGIDNNPALLVPVPDRPEDGLPSTRMSIGVGIHNNDAFSSLRYRPLFHGMLDNDTGVAQGTQIEVLSLDLRYYPGQERAELQNLEILDIASFAPRDDFIKPLSWKTRMGFAQSERNAAKDSLAFHFDAGAGDVWNMGHSGVWFLLPEAEIVMGPAYRADYAIGVGPTLGTILSFVKKWKIVVQAGMKYYGVGDSFWAQRYCLDQDYRLSRNVSISLELLHQCIDLVKIDEANLRVNYYW